MIDKSWFKEHKAEKLAKAKENYAIQPAGAIWYVELTIRGGERRIVWVLKIKAEEQKDDENFGCNQISEYRYFETNEEAKNARVLRGLPDVKFLKKKKHRY